MVMGVTERDGGSLFNSQVFVGADGTLLGRRRKLKPTSAERLVWGEGDGAGLRVFDTGETGRLGGLICGEHNLALARFTMQSQQEQLHVASYPDPLMEGRPFYERVDAAAALPRDVDWREPHPPPSGVSLDATEVGSHSSGSSWKGGLGCAALSTRVCIRGTVCWGAVHCAQ